jgi:hypothetical protein
MSKFDKTEIMILGTIHGMHKSNEFYSYEDVFSIVDNFRPNVIGVEIRDEDISQTREYLNRYYPYEMVETKFRYENNCSIYGFDWLGKSIEGKLIPEKYFETLDIKMLEKEFDAAQEYIRVKDMLEVINKIRIQFIINHTVEECNDGKYDIANEIFYSQLEVGLKETRYEQISDFYKERDAQIDNNMIKIIEGNKGKRILFLTGVDHRTFAI